MNLVMLMKWWRQPARDRTIETIYGAIVAQARNPVFYARYGVPDTVEGRFDMIVLHLFLYLHRVSGPAFQAGVGQPLFDRFCADLDGNLREMGIGDLSVPKRMQKFGEAFYGRSAAYAKALMENDREAAAVALSRNVYGRETPTTDVRELSTYMFAAAQALRNTDDARLQRGEFSFPSPQSVAEKGHRSDGAQHAEHE
jgi:cytochrome b pre-mRNA-processing protein 3